MQERLLAPRTAYFGRGQVFWECRQLNACEIYPLGIPSTIYLGILPKELSINNWNEIVRIYSRGAFTYEKDKLVALSGIARKIQDQTNDEYAAGFWRKGLKTQLCWEISPSATQKAARRRGHPRIEPLVGHGHPLMASYIWWNFTVIIPCM
jgi:hypothetical protein